MKKKFIDLMTDFNKIHYNENDKIIVYKKVGRIFYQVTIYENI